MKANAPEKLYFFEGETILSARSKKIEDANIEYVRTDAFIEKACEFLKSYRQEIYDGVGYIAGIVNDETIDDFINYMEGE